jgi:hypothetical protein
MAVNMSITVQSVAGCLTTRNAHLSENDGFIFHSLCGDIGKLKGQKPIRPRVSPPTLFAYLLSDEKVIEKTNTANSAILP